MAVLDHYLQGSFTADGNSHIINLPTSVDFFEVENLTRIITPQNGTGVKFRWMNGFAAASAIEETTNGSGVVTIQQITTNGFTLINTADPQTPGAQLSGTAISNATPPVCSSANTGSLSVGNIVELYNCTGATQFNGMQFTVTAVTPNSVFTLGYAPTIVAGTTFNYRIIPAQPMYTNPHLFITAVTQATSAVVTLSVTHNISVGNSVVFGNVSSLYGMTQLSGQRAVVTAVNTTNNTITINLNTSGYTAFSFPLTAATPFARTQPSLVVFGSAGNATSGNPQGNQWTLSDATRNTAVIGMLLGGGANGPAGQSGDVVYWRGWKAEQVQTTYYS